MRLAALSLLVLIAAPQSAAAGAWAYKPGTGQAINTISIGSAKESFSGGSTIAANYTKTEDRIFWEHGLSKTLTAVVQTGYQDLSFTSGGQNITYSGLARSSAGLRLLIWKDKNTVFSAETSARFSGAGSEFSAAGFGADGINTELRLLLGRSFKVGKRDGFAEIQTAWRSKSGAESASVHIDVSSGVYIFDKLQIIGQSFYRRSVDASDPILDSESLHAQGQIIYWRRPKTAVQIGINSVLAGQNHVKETSILAGFWRRY